MADWNRILDERSCAFSHEFWKVIEQSRMNDFSFRYVLFLDDNEKAIALTSFYSVTTDVAIFAPVKLRRFLTGIRRVFPNFLKLRMLEWGTPITISSPPFVSAQYIEPHVIIQHFHALLMQTAQEEGRIVIVARDFEPDANLLEGIFTGLGYHWVNTLPNTYLNITWASIHEYHASLKSYYRSKLLKHVRRNLEQNIHHRLVDDFDHLADQLAAQWMVVHNQADEFQREVLTSGFYREFSRGMGSRSKAVLFYRQDELVGHALLLLDGNVLIWMYFGREVAINDSLYIYAAHAVIETAISLGVKRLQMGLTTYPVKQDLGAQVTPIKLAIRATSPFINPFVGWFYRALNNPPHIQSKRIFKKSCLQTIDPVAK